MLALYGLIWRAVNLLFPEGWWYSGGLRVLLLPALRLEERNSAGALTHDKIFEKTRHRRVFFAKQAIKLVS